MKRLIILCVATLLLMLLAGTASRIFGEFETFPLETQPATHLVG